MTYTRSVLLLATLALTIGALTNPPLWVWPLAWILVLLVAGMVAVWVEDHRRRPWWRH